jgi:hypothetical protein
MSEPDSNLEFDKLRAEIEVLDAITDKLTAKPEPAPPAKKKNFFQKLSLGQASILITVLVSIFGLWKEVGSYVDSQNRSYRLTYSQDMIKLFQTSSNDTLNSEDRNQALLLLSGYELDALPLVLHALEKEAGNSRINAYARTCRIIMDKDSDYPSEVLDFIIKSNLEFIGVKAGEVYEEKDVNTLYNYIELLGKFGDVDSKSILKHFRNLESLLKQAMPNDRDKPRLDDLLYTLGVVESNIKLQIKMFEKL